MAAPSKAKATKKETKPKAAKKETKPKTTKKVEKKTEKKPIKKTVKKTEKKIEKKPKETKVSKIKDFVAEAIASNMTDDAKWVSLLKIRKYFDDYYETNTPTLIHNQITKAIDSLVAKNLIKQKRSSYTFSVAGMKKVKPDKIPKRKKIERPKKEEPEPAKEAPKELRFSTHGREIKPVSLD